MLEGLRRQTSDELENRKQKSEFLRISYQNVFIDNIRICPARRLEPAVIAHVEETQG